MLLTITPDECFQYIMAIGGAILILLFFYKFLISDDE